jgi:hypothetical protein
LFRDGMHLEPQGIARFSVMLAGEVERLLGVLGTLAR